MSEVAKLIKKRRQELGMSLEDVAKKVGVGRSTVRKWEEGMIKSIKSDKLEALSDVLHLSPVELVPGRKKSFGELTADAIVKSKFAEAGAFTKPIMLKRAPKRMIKQAGAKDIRIVKVSEDPALAAMLKVWKVSDPKAKEAAVKMLETMADIKK